MRLIQYPVIRFHAFHPDLVYVAKNSTNRLIPNYHSALIVWGYVNGIDPVDIAAQFTNDVYAEAGYYDYWDTWAKKLEIEFESCGLSFRDFILAAKREGVFMYTFDHPKPSALAILTKLIGRKLGAPDQTIPRYLDIDDHLHGSSWPCYPEIARSYLTEGSFLWQIDGRFLNLREFIDLSYERCRAENLQRDDYYTSQLSEIHARLGRTLGNRLRVQ